MGSFPLGGVVRGVLSLGGCGAWRPFPWEVWCVASFPLGGVVRVVLSLGRCGNWCPFSLWAGDQILRDNPLATLGCLIHDGGLGVKCVVVMLIVVLLCYVYCNIIQMIKYRILLMVPANSMVQGKC